MRKLTLILAVVLLTLLVACNADASQSTKSAAARPWSHVARAPLPVPMPDVIYEHCPGNGDVYGCAFMPGDAAADGRVFPHGAVFLRGHDRFSKLHEVGHVFAQTMMDASERWRYEQIRDMGDLGWTWADDLGDGVLVQGQGTPDEDFADAYANCRMQHTRYGLWEAGYGYYPDPREHWRVCRFIVRAAEDPGYRVTPDELG